MILTERDMYELCLKEAQAGRAPRNIEFLHAPLPMDLADKLKLRRDHCAVGESKPQCNRIPRQHGTASVSDACVR
jgi:hypothetical protein